MPEFCGDADLAHRINFTPRADPRRFLLRNAEPTLVVKTVLVGLMPTLGPPWPWHLDDGQWQTAGILDWLGPLLVRKWAEDLERPS